MNIKALVVSGSPLLALIAVLPWSFFAFAEDSEYPTPTRPFEWMNAPVFKEPTDEADSTPSQTPSGRYRDASSPRLQDTSSLKEIVNSEDAYSEIVSDSGQTKDGQTAITQKRDDRKLGGKKRKTVEGIVQTVKLFHTGGIGTSTGRDPITNNNTNMGISDEMGSGIDSERMRLTNGEVALEPVPIWGVPHYEEDTFSDVVAIVRGKDLVCTGVVIAPRLVLTAGHCRGGETVRVALDMNKPVLESGIREEQRPPNATIDAKLLVLDHSLPVTYRPFRLAEMQDGPRSTLRLLGFGATDTRGTRGQGTKRIGDVSGNGWGCTLKKHRMLGCDPDTEMVLSSSTLDTCNGDSGGPVLEMDWISESWRLVAITSRPKANARRRCGDGGVYVRVDTIADWLSETIRQMEQPNE